MPSLFSFKHSDPYAASTTAPPHSSSQQQHHHHKRSRSAGGTSFVVPYPNGVAISEPPPRPQSAMGNHHRDMGSTRSRPYVYDHRGERDNTRSGGRGRSGSLHAIGHAHPGANYGRPAPDYVPVDIAASATSSVSGSFEMSVKERRPQSLRRTTWHPAPPSNMQPGVKIHRALACTKDQPALLYDIVYAPSHDNILTTPKPTSAASSGGFSLSSVFRNNAPRKHASLATPLPPHTLALAATRPLVPSLMLSIPGFSSDWDILAKSMSITTDPQYTALTNLDVIHAIYHSLRRPVSKREWNSLGEGSAAQKRVAEAYKRRCEKLGSRRDEWDAGVRRSDFLAGRTALLGIECKSDGRFELVFGKPSA